MTYNEFVCECVMRLGVVIKPETGKPAIQPAGCLFRAFALADTLVKGGFMSPSLGTLRNKFEVYADVLSQASERRRSEQISQCGTIPTISCDKSVEMMEGLYHEDREERDKTRRLLNQYDEKLALDLSREVLELIKPSISPRRDFYATANLLLPELSEQIRKRDGGESAEGTPVDTIMDQMLNFLDFGREENIKNAFDEERELIDTVDRHKKNDNYAKELHEEFTAIGETERRVKEVLWQVREAAANA